MKKLLAILCCICIFVPETARIIAGNICSYSIINEDAEPVCACIYNNVPVEMPQAALPDRHKDLLQKTDWQYITTQSMLVDFSLACNTVKPLASVILNYTSFCTGGVFRPPCFS